VTRARYALNCPLLADEQSSANAQPREAACQFVALLAVLLIGVTVFARQALAAAPVPKWM